MIVDGGARVAKRAWIIVALLVACARPAVRPTPQLRQLGAGVTLTVAPADGAPRAAPAGATVAAFRVAVQNLGTTALKIKYRDFSLMEAGPARSPALLPAELEGVCAPSSLLPEGVLPPGQSASGMLYFRRVPGSPTASVNPRVVLESVDEVPLSTNLIALILG